MPGYYDSSIPDLWGEQSNFRTMADVEMTMFARGENINSIAIARLAITGMMHLFRLID